MLDKCIELVTQVSGRRPTGYVAPWWEFSTVTNELLLERHSSARGDRRQPHGSFLTRRWREMDSNFRFLVARPSNRHGRGRDYCLEKRKPICWGTEGSNPAPSSGESGANLTSSPGSTTRARSSTC